MPTPDESQPRVERQPGRSPEQREREQRSHRRDQDEYDDRDERERERPPDPRDQDECDDREA